MGKKEDIFSAAYELFSKNGFKSVNVADITRLAGISVGSFYHYYPSKEDLFIEIYMEENKKVKDHIIKSLDLSAWPAEIAQKFISLNMEAMKNNLILCEWCAGNIEKELKAYYQNNPQNYATSVRGFLEALLDQWRCDHKLREDMSNEEIMAVFDALAYLDANLEDHSSAGALQTVQWLVKFAALGITKQQGTNS